MQRYFLLITLLAVNFTLNVVAAQEQFALPPAQARAQTLDINDEIKYPTLSIIPMIYSVQNLSDYITKETDSIKLEKTAENKAFLIRSMEDLIREVEILIEDRNYNLSEQEKSQLFNTIRITRRKLQQL